MPDLDAIRAHLLRQTDELATRVDVIESHLRGVDRDAPNDWKDRAQFLENDEVLEALEDHDRAELLQIRAALGRLDAGTYGSCASCGGDIAKRRLEALPIATKCIACAA
ncbi:MAG: TraR/DksA family transcriptional regulator [Proteobacteria bacterium]|nr:TraR/DksA family transcriptional regulator [Pseudomonadota bacterium]